MRTMREAVSWYRDRASTQVPCRTMELFATTPRSRLPRMMFLPLFQYFYPAEAPHPIRAVPADAMSFSAVETAVFTKSDGDLIVCPYTFKSLAHAMIVS